jgi:hypothetical protein
MSLREEGCEVVRWMEMSQDRVQSRTLVLAAIKLRVVLPQCLFSYL